MNVRKQPRQRSRSLPRFLTRHAPVILFLLLCALWLLLKYASFQPGIAATTATGPRRNDVLLDSVFGLGALAILWWSLRRSAKWSDLAGTDIETVIDSLPVAFLALEEDRRTIALWNAESEAIMGYSRDEMIGDPEGLKRLIPDQERRTAIIREWDRRSDNFYNWEWDITTRDGGIRTIAWSNISGRGGRIPGLGTWGIGVDVTASKQIETALMESEHKFRSFIEQSSDGIILTDEAGYIVNWNHGAELITGIRSVAALGRPAWDLYYDVVPSAETSDETYQRLRETAKAYLETGESDWLDVMQELVLHQPGGDDRILQILMFPIVTNRGFLLGGIVRDVSDRRRTEQALRESEELYRQMFERNQAIKYLLDADTGAFLDANPAALQFYGYSLEELKQKTIGDINTMSREAVARAMKEARSSDNVTFNFRHRIASGEVRDVEIHTGPVDLPGRPALYSIVHDVTQRREAERARERLIAELNSFAHTVAHDLKNPLSIVTGFGSMLTDFDDPLTGDQYETAVNAILQSANKMEEIIDELLLLAQVHDADIAIGPVDMGHVVDEARQRLLMLLNDKQIELVIPREWPTVRSYGPWLEEVWANYLSNAIKYGGRPVRIELGAEMLARGIVRFYVKDDGPGIDPDEVNRLFQPFSRINPETHEETTGHGLGLSIVRRIIERLGGEVGVESEPGKGSTFTFTQPLHR